MSLNYNNSHKQSKISTATSCQQFKNHGRKPHKTFNNSCQNQCGSFCQKPCLTPCDISCKESCHKFCHDPFKIISPTCNNNLIKVNSFSNKYIMEIKRTCDPVRCDRKRSKKEKPCDTFCRKISKTQLCRGPKGDPGPKGEMGCNGFRGKQGPKGQQGERGRRGKMGPCGPFGCRGPPGIQGKVGCRGFKGKQGKPGPCGHHGPHGPPGVCGVRGPRGFKGDKGDKGCGIQGPIGCPGVKGPCGKQGPPGKCCCSCNSSQTTSHCKERYMMECLRDQKHDCFETSHHSEETVKYDEIIGNNFDTFVNAKWIWNGTEYIIKKNGIYELNVHHDIDQCLNIYKNDILLNNGSYGSLCVILKLVKNNIIKFKTMKGGPIKLKRVSLLTRC